MPRILVLVVMALGLAACGGGGKGGGGSNGGTTNGAPTVTTSSFTVNQDTDLSTKITASDPENDALTLAKVSDPAHGSIVTFATDGTFRYRPTASYRGADSFGISVADATHTVNVTINITVAAVNQAPTVTTSSFTVNQDTDLSSKIAASDPENDPLTLAKTSDPTHGAIVSFATDGSFLYRPTAGYQGADSFGVSVADASHTISVTINITVAAVNHAPTIVNDVVSATGSSPLIDVLKNDSDPDNDALTLSIDEGATVGTATVVNGKVQLTGLPSGFKGVTRFKYHAQDPGGLGSSATAAVFVDTAPVRLVYQTNEGVGIQNLFVDDLTGRRQVSALTSTSTTSLGHSNVSTNGHTVVWEEATGSDSGGNYQAQSIWTIPADLSSPARKISPTLAAGETLSVRSPISADGQYIVYGVTAGGTETLFLANLLPNGSSAPLPPPAGTLRIESGPSSQFVSILFGPSSQFVYFTATTSVGGVEGQATYRIPVGAPTAAVQISTAPVANRQAAIRLIANDDSRVVEVLAVTGTAPLIERVDFVAGVAGMPITLSHALAATDKVVDVKADPNLATIAYMVRTTNTIPFELYFADVATPVTGQLVGSIQSDSVNPPPTIDAVRKNGDAALVHTLQLVSVGPPATYNEILREIDLSTAAISRPIQTRPQGLNVYTYVDDFTSVAFTTNTGVSVAPRSNLAQQQVIFSAAAAFFEFSADNQLLAAITAPTALPPLSLFLVNRGTGALQLTGLSNDPTVRTLSIRLVPGTTTN